MAHGGTWGSRPGEYRGGRSKGTPNKKTQARILGFERAGVPPEVAVKLPHQLPLEFLLTAMADENLPIETRLNAARWAAPYVHSTKGRVDVSGASQPLVVQILRFSPEASDTAVTTIEHDKNEAA